MYTKESLNTLKEKIDLIDVVSSQIEVKRAGTAYKALCPFHDEKSPSFTLKRGDSHYHCFGCGAHGDAIAFLMQLQGLTFREAVEMLAERFHIPLQEEDKVEKGPSSLQIQEVLNFASHFYHFYLQRTEEGRVALNYLTKRGLSLDFIRRFEIGFAPEGSELFFKAMREKKYSKELMQAAGLLSQDGRRLFFRERVTFPVRNPRGSVIGFSARKIREETFGGKYINTSETALFKKSRLLFGLNYSRKRIVKEQKALIVEGQIDCLRLIDEGLDYVVASLGTAFGQGHVQTLKNLGARTIQIAFDSDKAGIEAASKTGALFQKEGIGVEVLLLPQGMDPDTFLNEQGKEAFLALQPKDYLSFRVQTTTLDLKNPAGKTQFVKEMKQEIESWNEPVMVHESLQKLAQLVQLPQQMVGGRRPVYRRPAGTKMEVDPDRVLEIDLLRLLIRGESRFRAIVKKYVEPSYFMLEPCQKLYSAYLKADDTDLLSVMSSIDDVLVERCVDEIMSSKLKNEKIEELFLFTVQKMMDRKWLSDREAIQREINGGGHSDEKMLELARQYSQTKRPVAEI
ncbi:MAG: DNA primase [Chlamydiales bacterium]|nr:DNA primase [Chlamydiales bacterium]MCH9635436.1 DNA primase [Chlamydiales bacterium]MCH9703629.1 DNA primase [Chlamydiota bacterium]